MEFREQLYQIPVILPTYCELLSVQVHPTLRNGSMKQQVRGDTFGCIGGVISRDCADQLPHRQSLSIVVFIIEVDLNYFPPNKKVTLNYLPLN